MNNGIKFILAVVLVGGIGALLYLGYQNFFAPVAASPTPAVTQVAAENLNVVSAEGRVVPFQTVALTFAQGGRVTEVLVEEGQMVRAGDVLVRLDAGALNAAQAQAEAALVSAQANLQAAQTRLEQARTAALAAAQPDRVAAWGQRQATAMEQPAWYFSADEARASAEAEVEAARSALAAAQQNLAGVLAEASRSDVAAAETRISNARAAFRVAQAVLDQANTTSDRDLRDEARRRLDIAQSELEAAQDAYDDILSTEAAADVLEARARLAVARERYDTAVDRLNSLRTGEESLEIRAAEDAVTQAEALVNEARAGVRRAQIAVSDAVLTAPIDGVAAEINTAPGEIASPASPLVILMDTSTWMIETNDLPESDVVLVEPGQTATVTLDAFPDRTFEAVVAAVALVGEDSRGLVTYTVRLSLNAAPASIRWGMTAFVDIALR